MRRVRATVFVMLCGGLVACRTAALPRPRQQAMTDVHVDRRVELVALVERLSGAAEYNDATTPYAAETVAAFKQFVNHPAVLAARELREKHEIEYDAPMQLAIRLDDAYQLHELDDLVARDVRWRGVDAAGFAAKLRDFAAVSKFDAYTDAHAAYYAKVQDALRSVIDAEHPVAWFDARFGVRRKARYTVVPALLVGMWNFGVRALHDDGTVEMVQIISIFQSDGMPQTDADAIATVVHEMAHSYINPVFDRHLATLEPAARQLFPLVERELKVMAYVEPKILLYESAVRAVTALYVRDRRGAGAGREALRIQQRVGFVWTPELAAAIDRLPRGDLEAAMPAVADAFSQIAARYAGGLPPHPFWGPVSNVVLDPTTVIAAPAGADARLTEWIAAARERDALTSPIVTASPTTLSEHPRAGVIAYGGAATNPVVAATLERTGWQVAPDHISIAGKTFTGDRLILIACAPRADDSDHGIAIYAAQEDRDLVGLTFRHGNMDWLVMRKTEHAFELVAYGDFPFRDDGTLRLGDAGAPQN